jgi:uncharacterized membrane protein
VRKLYEDIRSSLWFRPGLWMLVYAAVGMLLVWGEARLGLAGVDLTQYEVLRTDASGARTMLGAIATAMLTVTSLVFSLMMLAVVQTANAYSPRLLRRYISDPANQHVLGILIGTFVYSMVVLRAVSGNSASAPVIATNMALLLSLVATVALVHFLNHVPQSIKVSSIISLILSQTQKVIERGFPRDVGHPWEGEGKPVFPESQPRQLCAHDSGYVQYLADEKLLRTAYDADLVIRMHWRMGDYILAGTAIASVWGELDEKLEGTIRRACILGVERTLPQDAGFGLQQLTDIALRALSPGVNDPSTAATSIDAVTFLLGKALDRELPSPYRCDEEGDLRLVLPRASFSELIEDSYLRILQYGGQDVAIMRQLLRACEQLHTIARGEAERELLWSLVEAIHDQARTTVTIPPQQRQLDRLFQHTCSRLERPSLPLLAGTA